jgi:hypothetical protein
MTERSFEFVKVFPAESGGTNYQFQEEGVHGSSYVVVAKDAKLFLEAEAMKHVPAQGGGQASVVTGLVSRFIRESYEGKKVSSVNQFLPMDAIKAKALVAAPSGKNSTQD